MSKGDWQKALKSAGAVVITGGSSGIGEIFIDRILKLGEETAVCNISRRSPGKNFAKDRILHIGCDLSDANAAAEAADRALAFCGEHARGHILLINNSGFGSCGFFPEPEISENLDMIAVNTAAPVLLTARLLPELKRRGGWILNVASTAAFQPTPYLAVYGATKAFLLHWSLALDAELRGTPARAMALCPGPTSTAFFQRAGFSRPVVSDRWGQTPEEVVDHALAALARGKRLTVPGWSNRLLSSLSSLVPKSLSAGISERILRRYRLQMLSGGDDSNE